MLLSVLLFFFSFSISVPFSVQEGSGKAPSAMPSAGSQRWEGPRGRFHPHNAPQPPEPKGASPVPTPLSPSTPPGFPCSPAGSCSATQRGRSTAYFAPWCCCLLLPLLFFLPSPAEEEEEGHGHAPSSQDPIQKGHQSIAQWDAACHLNACKWFLLSYLHLRR